MNRTEEVGLVGLERDEHRIAAIPAAPPSTRPRPRPKGLWDYGTDSVRPILDDIGPQGARKTKLFTLLDFRKMVFGPTDSPVRVGDL